MSQASSSDTPVRHGKQLRQARRIGAAGAALVAALAGMSAAGAPAASAGVTENVIVTSTGVLGAATAVLGLNGTILTTFHLINGVEAALAPALVPLLDALPGISVTPDAQVSVQSTTAAAGSAAAAGPAGSADAPAESTGPHTPSDVFRQETGADQLAAAGDTGQGVTVAVMDTGIDSLPDFAGRLAGGADLTGAGDPFRDSYGHGTFVAGLIAGNGASSGGQYSGEAPGARLVSIKVAGADGTTHLSTLITGLQWAVDHRSQYGIKVLNLSLGFQSSQPTETNALDQAAEATWNSGIAVVVSAGNSGPFNGTILSPGDDPLVITAGALDDMATPDPGDDEMNDFSAAGPTAADGWAKPDLVTSGRSVVSLAAPGSTIDTSYPSGRLGTATFVGSGTSFSAAITSGAAALVLADNPGLTPNQLKGRLLATASPGPLGNPFVDGHGALSARAAAHAGPVSFNQSAAGLLPVLASLLISLDPASRLSSWNLSLWSGMSVSLPSGTDPRDGLNWDGGDWDGGAWTGRAWNDGWWQGALWNAGGWTGRAWNDRAWAGSSWSGAAWSGGAWSGSAWN
ncbi:MAG TPA: S8 family peptidase [Streptosporangiaceae bacterium]|nr:S8 family peptidase [Streptosporangiaceae bacterium]